MSDSPLLTQIINSYDSELRRVLIRRCGCVETASDILQETYQRIMSGDLWQRAENPRALLHRIAANLATDYERRHAVQNKYLSRDIPVEDVESVAQRSALQPDQILSQHERLERLAQAVEKLPPKCRTVFVLRKVQELSQAEIADQLGISRNMVEKHLRHALQVLQTIDDD